jgi:four helix bundle suffix protein
MNNYEKTITYQQAKQIFFFTQEFTKNFLNGYKDRRLIEQMVSSARSIKQNLSEGATRNSIKDYIQFIGFSRASSEELLEDYKDLAELWKIKVVRPSSSSSPSLSSSRAGAVNKMIDLITRNNYLSDQQRRSLEKHFIEHGGYTENLAKKRRIYRRY